MFKDRNKIHISIYLLIPAIFSGLSVISVIVTHRMAVYYLGAGIDHAWQFTWLGISVGAVTFMCGFLIMWLVLRPVSRFVKKAERMPVFTKRQHNHMPLSSGNHLEHYTQVLEQATNILDNVEAKELFPNIVGQSRIMREVFSKTLKVAQSDTTVLISGESGTGKELIATSIYEHSSRKDMPFIKLNCVAIPEGLLESELFGHEKGAFTGAISQKKGKFELADGGTIFMDEIGDMPLPTQAKLLRVLQEREFERVGGTQTHKINIRIITATNKNLPEMVKAGRFRKDLYYRLNVFSIHLPALRERMEDIHLLIGHFLRNAHVHTHKQLKLSSRTLKLLVSYSWPGNVRELQNTIESATVMAENGTINPVHLSFGHNVQHNGNGLMMEKTLQGFSETASVDTASINDRLGEIEKCMIMDAMVQARGVQAKASHLLGINQRSLWHRIKKYSIDVASLKSTAQAVENK